MFRFHRFFLSFLVFLFASLPAVYAQTSRGTLSGFVRDPSGAAVAGAGVELLNLDTQVLRTSNANDAGLYRFEAVDPGRYSVTVKSPGFETAKTSDFPIVASQIATIDVELRLGQQSTLLEVTAATAQLKTESAVRGGSISSREETQLPVANRNPVSLALTLPGVSTNRFGFGVQTFSVNGSRGRSNNFLIDGTENNDISIAGQAFQITIPDAVQETNVQTSNFDSEYGRAGGAVVNVITKSGTNQFHGTASYLLDSTFDDAISNVQRQNPQVVSRGRPLPGTEQIWAGTLGGPVKRDRTFFFVAFQEDRQQSSGTLSVNTPSPAGWATLDSLFPQGANPRKDLYRSIVFTTPATSGFFPLSLGRFNGVSRPDVQFGNATITYGQKNRDREYLVRGDHQLSSKDYLSGRYADDDVVNPSANIDFPGFGTSQQNKYRNALFTETHVFSPTITNEFRLAYNRIALSFPVDATNPLARTLPNYNIQNIIGPNNTFGVATNLPQGRVANNYTLQDTISVTRGTHSVRAGLDLLDQRSRQFAPIVQRGLLTYNADNVYSSFANFLDDFGGSNGLAQRDFGNPAYYPKLLRQQYFVQDRWRVTEALTLSLGLRYEYFDVPVNSIRTPAFTGLYNIDPVTGAGPFNQPNKVKPDKNNFSPSVGIAYSPAASDPMARSIFGEHKTVFRAGYQIGYDSFFNNIASNAATSSPNVVSTLTNSLVSSSAPRGLANLSAALPQNPRALTPLDSQTLVVGKLVNPYYQKWSGGFERQLPGNFVVDASYVGTKGTKLFLTEDLNPLVPASLQHQYNVTIPASRRVGRLDPLQGARNIRTNGGSSSYHAFQTELNRRFGGGFAMQLSYTRSRLIDYGSEIFSTSGVSAPATAAVPTILGGLPQEKAVSLFDRPNRISLSFDYPLPFFKSQRGLFGRVLDGWELSGIYTYESGVPFTVTNGLDADGIGGATDRPDFNPNGQRGVRAVPASSTHPSTTGYVNPEANFAPINPAQAEFIVLPTNSGRTGNLGRNTQRTPPTDNLNTNLLKTFKLTERFGLEFRGEFYNVLNHPQYAISSVSPFAPASVGTLQANANSATPGRFLATQFLDTSARIIRYQIKLTF